MRVSHLLEESSGALRTQVPIPDEVRARIADTSSHPDVERWSLAAARRLDSLDHGLVFCIGCLDLGYERSRALALAITSTLCSSLRILGAPNHMRVEVDIAQTTRVFPGHRTRTLLPHHDSAHCSYLTPSLVDDPTWSPALRSTSDHGITTTQTHKLYSGFFVAEAGEALSITTYYNKAAILRRAQELATKTLRPSPVTLARWLGSNIRQTFALRTEHPFRYLTLGAALGARLVCQRVVPVHWAEACFSAEEVERFPELRCYNDLAPAEHPALHFLSDLLEEALGMSWSQFQNHYESRVPSVQHDLVIGHNLTLMHGGLDGGMKRVLEPICLVVDSASGDEYESWLARAWRGHSGSMDRERRA